MTIDNIAGAPAGVIGMRAAGKLTADGYRDVLDRALQGAIDAGEADALAWAARSTA